jgi:hypothetical protein
MNYETTTAGGITYELDGIRYFVPRDPENVDYQLFLEWEAQGNTPGTFTPPPGGPSPE